MANVKRLDSPRELLDYLNELTLPAGGFHGSGAAVGATGFDIIDCGARYTVLEETPFLITTVNSERDLAAFLGSLAGTLREVVPKKEGGEFTYYSLVDEVLGQANDFAMTISKSQQGLEDDMNALADAGQAVEMIIEHDNYTVLISSPWDSDALAIFNRMPVALSVTEQVAINDFVIAEKAALNWASYDEIYCFGLFTESNARTGLLQSKLTGGIPSKVVNGFAFDNNNDSMLSDLDMPNLANYIQDDAHLSAFIYTNDSAGLVAFRSAMGFREPSGLFYGRAATNASTNQTTYAVNSDAVSYGVSPTDQSHNVARRNAGANMQHFVDGVQLDTKPIASKVIPVAVKLVVGGEYNLDTLSPASSWNGILSFISVGSDFANYPANNTNVRNLLTALGAI